jgi:uncharacterized protein (DUF1330 family)
MPAYLIADITVTDAEEYARYRPLAEAAIKRHGGRYLVRGGAVEVREGDWTPGRFVIVEFDSPERAREFYESAEYQEALAIRQRAADSRIFFVEGA